MKVYFIGAGPGDPKLLTIKGKELIERSQVILYAGSLVNKEILKYAISAKEIIDSASLNLEEIGNVFKKAKKNNLDVARIQSGEPSIYGAINEQIKLLKTLDISYLVVPGISCFQAAAASITQELTIPNVCQTVTLSRVAGRTPVPKKERLEELIKTKPTLFLFLSIAKLPEVVTTLLKEYPKDTPIAIFYKISWPDEKIITSTLENIIEKMKNYNISRSALILVGEVLKKDGDKSLLYDKNFSHICRK